MAIPTFIRSLKAAQFEGSESREVVMTLPIGTLSFSGIDYLNGWALPNFYFHYTTAYNILRHCGVELSKSDFLGAVPGAVMPGAPAKKGAAKKKAAAKKPAAKKKAAAKKFAAKKAAPSTGRRYIDPNNAWPNPRSSKRR